MEDQTQMMVTEPDLDPSEPGLKASDFDTTEILCNLHFAPLQQAKKEVLHSELFAQIGQKYKQEAYAQQLTDRLVAKFSVRELLDL